MTYPIWVVNTLTGKQEVVSGYLELNEDGVVRIYQEDGETTRTEFVAALMNLDYIVRDDEEDEE